jgi:hypothetical protein
MAKVSPSANLVSMASWRTDHSRMLESMPGLTILLLIAWTLQFCAAPASAETRQFANVVYELPKG